MTGSELSKGVVGFSAVDFDSYEEKKWRSNRFNIERMRVREKLKAVGKLLQAHLVQTGEPVVMETSDPHPHILNGNKVSAAWLTINRNEEERKELARVLEKELPLQDMVNDPSPLNRHVIWALKVTEKGLDIFAGFHSNAWIDARNFFNKIEREEYRERFLGILAGLGSAYNLTVGNEILGSLDGMTGEILLACRGALETCSLDTPWFIIGQHVGRDDPRLLDGDRLIELCTKDLSVLYEIYRFIAWTKTNDHLRLSELLAEMEAAKRRDADATPAPAMTNRAPKEGSEETESGRPLEILAGVRRMRPPARHEPRETGPDHPEPQEGKSQEGSGAEGQGTSDGPRPEAKPDTTSSSAASTTGEAGKAQPIRLRRAKIDMRKPRSFGGVSENDLDLADGEVEVPKPQSPPPREIRSEGASSDRGPRESRPFEARATTHKPAPKKQRDLSGPIVVGDRVRIASGLFTGKFGVVVDIKEREERSKVQVKALSVILDTKSLIKV